MMCICANFYIKERAQCSWLQVSWNLVLKSLQLESNSKSCQIKSHTNSVGAKQIARPSNHDGSNRVLNLIVIWTCPSLMFVHNLVATLTKSNARCRRRRGNVCELSVNADWCQLEQARSTAWQTSPLLNCTPHQHTDHFQHSFHTHRKAEKRTNFLLCVFLLILDRNWWILLYILRNIYATIPCILFWHALRILCNKNETINTSR